MLVIFLIASGIFIISSRDDPNEYVYNNFRVFKNPTIGYTVVAYLDEQPYHLQLRNDPKSTENITINSEIKELILEKEAIFFTLDPNFNSVPVLGATEMANIFGTRLGIFNKRVFGAITKEADPPTGNIVVNCNNVSVKSNIVRLQVGDETKVYKEENNCIIVQGTDEWEIIRASDRLIYDVLGVIEN
jgi:hypothetical protein